MEITHTSPKTARRILSHAGGVALMALGLLVIASSPAVAATACGTYSFGFEGTRLLNDGISTSAGPFDISLPAGTYDITLVSNDNHPNPEYQPAQTQEQWYVALDNGFTSPPSNDIPGDQTRTVTTFASVEVAEATAISVHHLQSGGINSVNVECVGFTPTAPPETTTTTPPETTTTAPPETTTSTTEVTEIIEVAVPTTETPVAPVVVEPVIVEPVVAASTLPAPTVATTTPPIARVVVTPEAAAPEVETEVLAQVETPLPTVLARTGPENIELTLVGLALMIAGMTLVAFERRLTDMTPQNANI